MLKLIIEGYVGGKTRKKTNDRIYIINNEGYGSKKLTRTEQYDRESWIQQTNRKIEEQVC